MDYEIKFQIKSNEYIILDYNNCTKKKITFYSFFFFRCRCSIICPWGSNGACALDSNNSYFTFNAYQTEKIIDSLGAGDTFCAAVIFALSYQKKLLQDAIKFGNMIAGYKLSFYGYDEISKFSIQ